MKFVKITFDRFKIDCTKSFGIAITKKRRTITSNTRRAYKYWWMRSFETIAILIENVWGKQAGEDANGKSFLLFFARHETDRTDPVESIDTFLHLLGTGAFSNWIETGSGKDKPITVALLIESTFSRCWYIYINVTAVTNLRNHDTRSFVSRLSSSKQGTKHSNIFYYPIADRFDPILSSTRLITRLTLVRF